MFRSRKHLRTHRPVAVIVTLAAAWLAIAGCGDPVASVPLPREGAPDALEFSLGGFADDAHQWEVRQDTVVYRRSGWSGAVVDSVRVVPSADAWRAFWAAASEAGVGRWRRRYMAEGVVDGNGWGLRLTADGRTIESQGSNAYPDRAGREHGEEPTPEFDTFLDALGDLVGR